MLGWETWREVRPDVLSALCAKRNCVVETNSFSCAQRSTTLLCHIFRLHCKNKSCVKYSAFPKLALTVDVLQESGVSYGRPYTCWTRWKRAASHLLRIVSATSGQRRRRRVVAVGTCEPISQCLQPWFILNFIQRRIISEGPLGHNGAAVHWNSLFPMAFVAPQWL